MSRHISPDERETAIVMGDAFKRCTIYSEQKAMIAKIRGLARRHPDAVHIYKDGTHGRVPFIEADVPATFIAIRSARYTKAAANGNPSPLHEGGDEDLGSYR